ncbi:MAG: hypothetical protein IK079_01690, partial [Desulfovibrio sp.]|nr:hypothetical protein [Desulfovibrio sp.]
CAYEMLTFDKYSELLNADILDAVGDAYHIFFTRYVEKSSEEIERLVQENAVDEIFPKSGLRLAVLDLLQLLLMEATFSSDYVEKKSGKSQVELLVDNGQKLISKETIDFLNSFKGSYIGLYRVKSVSNKNVVLKDLIYPKKDLITAYFDIEEPISYGDILGARIINYKGSLFASRAVLRFFNYDAEALRTRIVMYLLAADCYDEKNKFFKEEISKIIIDLMNEENDKMLEFEKLFAKHGVEEREYMAALEYVSEMLKNGNAEKHYKFLKKKQSKDDTTELNIDMDFGMNDENLYENDYVKEKKLVVDIYSIDNWNTFLYTIKKHTDIHYLNENRWDFDGVGEDNEDLQTFFEKRDSQGCEVYIFSENERDAERMRPVFLNILNGNGTFIERTAVNFHDYMMENTEFSLRKKFPVLTMKILGTPRILKAILAILDCKLDVLGGKTMRQAVKVKKLRSVVVNLLQELEEYEEKTARLLGRDTVCLSSLWDELNLRRDRC